MQDIFHARYARSRIFSHNTVLPTMAHNNEEIQLYESAVQQTFNKLRAILSGGEDIGAHIIGPRCQPTFERLA